MRVYWRLKEARKEGERGRRCIREKEFKLDKEKSSKRTSKELRLADRDEKTLHEKIERNRKKRENGKQRKQK